MIKLTFSPNWTWITTLEEYLYIFLAYLNKCPVFGYCDLLGWDTVFLSVVINVSEEYTASILRVDVNSHCYKSLKSHVKTKVDLRSAHVYTHKKCAHL
jgi:hypothetical protein